MRQEVGGEARRGHIGDVGQRVESHCPPFHRPRAAPELMLGMAGGLPGNRSLSEGLTIPPLSRFPHRSAVGMGGLGLTCPGWHSRAAGVCQSRAVSPASGTVPQMQAELQIIPGGHQGVLGSPAGLPFCKESPVVLDTPVPPHPQQQMHRNCFQVPEQQGGWGSHPFTLLVTRFRSPASLLLRPSPAFS